MEVKPMKRLTQAALFVSLMMAMAPAIGAEDFPDGDGKTLILRSCGQCHSTDQIARQRKSEADWQATVVRMVGRGAKVSTDESNTIIKYLSTSFLKVEDKSKVNVNKATAADLLTLAFTQKEADAIIDYRTRHGDFRVWGDLLQIYGVDGEKAEAAQDKMTF
jgi:competence ComEA-like helix-hairpin-helix protein